MRLEVISPNPVPAQAREEWLKSIQLFGRLKGRTLATQKGQLAMMCCNKEIRGLTSRLFDRSVHHSIHHPFLYNDTNDSYLGGRK